MIKKDVINNYIRSIFLVGHCPDHAAAYVQISLPPNL